MHRIEEHVLGAAKLAVATTLCAALALPIVGCAGKGDTAGSAQETTTTEVEQPAQDVREGESVARDPDAILLSWNKDSEAYKRIVSFVEEVTDESSPSYVPVEDRIVVADLDGTLMCETAPWCFEYMVFADYALNNPDYDAPEDVRSVATEIVESAWGEKPENMSYRQAEAAAKAYAGLEPSELEDYVSNFMETDVDGFSGMKRSEAFYWPMVEAINYMRANGFEIYIVTATERNIVRAIVSDTLGIDSAHVIGTEYGYAATGQGDVEAGDYTFQPTDKVVFDGSYAGENGKMCKVSAIVREIGKMPIVALGNSSGDETMLVYTISDNPYPSLTLMVLDDDNVREYGDPEEAPKKREAWEKEGFVVTSMADDFTTIYGEGVEKTPVVPSE